MFRGLDGSLSALHTSPATEGDGDGSALELRLGSPPFASVHSISRRAGVGEIR